MPVTVIKRPLGHKLNTTDIEAVISDDGTGYARVYVAGGHGLSDGDYVFIESNFESYNGYKYVDSVAYDYFRIKESEAETAIAFIQEANITYFVSVLNHGWQCVHLPIVYELESDRYPVNVTEESYTPITIVSQAESNGATILNLSVGLSGATALNWIEIVGSGQLAGTYKILQVINPWQFVIDLDYDSGNDFSIYQVVNYFNNYFISVQVWAGLNASNRWADTKEYELANTLKLIPDSNNRVKFSIHEILKGYIQTRNNLTLDTLPNNLDFYVQFYIKYSENYDTSDGETITISEGNYTSDQNIFEGDAVNAMLPFKSEQISFMSEYINEDTLLARWLTLMDRPLMVAGRFFDLSFLNRYNNTDIEVIIFKSLSGMVSETEVITLDEPGSGVIRVPLEVEHGFDQYCLQAKLPFDPGFVPAVLAAIDTWANINDAGPAWTVVGGIPEVNTNLTGLNTTSDKWSVSYAFQVGRLYKFAYEFQTNVSSTFFISILDISNNVLEQKSISFNGTSSGTWEIVAPAGGVKISIHIFQSSSCGSGGSTCKKYILSFENMTSSIISDQVNITEQICCDVVEECDGTFINDNLRLLEGGSFRKLE